MINLCPVIQVDVLRLNSEIQSSGDPLLPSKTRIQELRQMLSNIEDNSGIREFGYKPFTENYAIDSMSTAVDCPPKEGHDDQEVKSDETYIKQDYGHQKLDIEIYRPNGSQINPNYKLANEERITRESPEELTRISDSSGEKTSQTVRFALNITEVPKNQMKTNMHTYGVKNEEKSDEKITKKYDKLLTRTPRLQDFGITRRFTLAPHPFIKPEPNARGQQCSTPEEPNFSSSQTCRYNYLSNTAFNIASNSMPMTPPNPDLSHNNSQATDSFVTVEFTPGLTTKRPKGISRINADNNRAKNENNRDHKRDNNRDRIRDDFNYQNRQKNWSEQTQSQRLPQSILQSMDNNSEVTPEQPITGADPAKSAKLLKSIAGKSSGTPPMPKSRVDVNIHQQILKNL